MIIKLKLIDQSELVFPAKYIQELSDETWFLKSLIEDCIGDDNIANVYSTQAHFNTSDTRDKADITNFTGGLTWINAMQPVTYKWDKRSWYLPEGEEDITTCTPDGTHKKNSLQIGLSAQAVLDIEKANGYGSNNDTSLLVDLSNDSARYSLAYSNIIPLLINAVKELSAKNDALEARIKTLEE